MPKAKEQTCWEPGCNNVVPRSEWPQEHAWGLWCREHLDRASGPYRAPGAQPGDPDEPEPRDIEPIRATDVKAALRQGQQP